MKKRHAGYVWRPRGRPTGLREAHSSLPGQAGTQGKKPSKRTSGIHPHACKCRQCTI